jgi:uncharacterized damage-inducible protein DinB
MRLASTIAAAALCAAAVVAVPLPVSAQGAQPVAQAVRASWNGAKQNIQESANVMPDAGYAFKPADTVRTFGQILAHIAGANYVFCAAAKGEKAPHAEDEFEKSATTRAAIIKALDASMAYCDAAFAEADDKSLGAPIEMPFGMGKGTRASALLGNIGHLNEHYGNLVTYFRLKGMVPPSSRR